MTYLAIDLGTSFLKGAVLDLESGGIRGVRRLAMPGPVPAGGEGFHELDPGTVVGSLADLIDDLLTMAGEVEGLVMCSQMHAVVLLDRNGSPCSNVITWQDQRARLPHPDGGGSYLDWALSRLGADERGVIGNEARPGVPSVTLPWFLDQPGGAALEGATVASLPDYALAALSGGEVKVEATIAAAYGLLDLATMEWNRTVIEKLGLAGFRFPELVSYREAVYLLERGGRRFRCFPPIGDHQAALLGGLLEPGEFSLNLSTGSQVSALGFTLCPGDYQTRPFFDGEYLNVYSHIPAGRALNVLVGLVTEMRRLEGGEIEDPWGLIAEAVETTESSDLEVDLSFFKSRETEAGWIGNIREANLTVGHLFRAAFESMADRYHRFAARLPGAEDVERLVFSGGLAQKLPVLREIIMERFGLEARLCQSEEDTMLGLLVGALAASGRAGSVREAMETVRGC